MRHGYVIWRESENELATEGKRTGEPLLYMMRWVKVWRLDENSFRFQVSEANHQLTGKVPSDAGAEIEYDEEQRGAVAGLQRDVCG